MTNESQYASTPPNLGSPEQYQREETGEAQTISTAAPMTGVVQYTIVFSRVQPSVLPTKLQKMLREL
jgi:hypothetical protein